jgi:hypothetical protein
MPSIQYPRLAKTCLASIALLAPLSAVAGDDDGIVTDRPDFVESSNVVGRGRFQIETSVLAERDKTDGVRARTYSMPTLLRYGVGDVLELRLETDGRTVQHANGEGTSAGYADTALGVKWHVQDEAPGRPSVGVLLHADLDSGSRAWRGQGVRPSLRVAAEWELPGDLSLGVMPGIGRERTDDGKRYGYGILGVVLGKELTPTWRAFVEVAAPQIARSANGGTVATFDTGMAWLLSDRCQLDTMLALGLNRRTPDAALTVGLSFKL